MNGNTVLFSALATVVTATGAVAGNDIQVSLPIPALAAWHTNFLEIGSGEYYDASTTASYRCLLDAYSASGFAALRQTNITTLGFLGSVGFADVCQVNDVVRLFGSYRAA